MAKTSVGKGKKGKKKTFFAIHIRKNIVPLQD
jgi:hypothetical protein